MGAPTQFQYQAQYSPLNQSRGQLNGFHHPMQQPQNQVTNTQFRAPSQRQFHLQPSQSRYLGNCSPPGQTQINSGQSNPYSEGYNAMNQQAAHANPFGATSGQSTRPATNRRLEAVESQTGDAGYSLSIMFLWALIWTAVGSIATFAILRQLSKSTGRRHPSYLSHYPQYRHDSLQDCERLL